MFPTKTRDAYQFSLSPAGEGKGEGVAGFETGDQTIATDLDN